MHAFLRSCLKAVALPTLLPETALRHCARRRLTVIAYHRIRPLPGADYPFDPDVISATPEEFEREMRLFRKHLDILSIEDVLAGLDDPGSLPLRPAVITFDDGYADNYEAAFPILRELDLPACFFVSTGLVGTTAVPWWDQVACCMKHAPQDRIPSPFGADDPDYEVCGPSCRAESTCRFLRRLKRVPWRSACTALEELRRVTGVCPDEFAARPLFMSWEMVRQMSAAGMDIGGHTRSHPVLSRLEDPAVLRDEVCGCYQDLYQRLGRAPLAFSYPVGSRDCMSAAADREIRAAGFRLSFSYEPGFGALDSAHRLPRHAVEFGADHEAFRFGLLQMCWRMPASVPCSGPLALLSLEAGDLLTQAAPLLAAASGGGMS